MRHDLQKISLSCSIPVNFSYEIKIVKAHPFFKVEPRLGIIPANGTIDVKIIFSPMTLGRCTLKLMLLVGQYGFVPLDCEVSAMAVSGLIESREMAKADRRVLDFIINTGTTLNRVLGNSSTFHGNLTAKDAFSKMGEQLLSPYVSRDLGAAGVLGQLDRFADTRFLQTGGTRYHHADPVAVMLSNTFRSDELDGALDRTVTDKLLIGSKVLHRSKDGKWQGGVRAVHGTLKSTLPVRPRGPGSGLVFDAGAQWAAIQHSQYNTRKLTKSKTKGNNREGAGVGGADGEGGGEEDEEGPDPQQKVVAGLRIPAMLDSVQSVSFVLTQEAGKLKPKDLKVAIDRNRAERDARAAEQERMREEGGGAGSLDRSGVLAEEKMNVAGDGDPFKRQLRELAFLADVDEVEKQEADKEFRVSEEYLGSLLLSEEDVDVILRQRQLIALRKQRAQWRVTQGRQHSKLFPPTHANVKAGAPTAVVQHAVACLTPSFDTNRNDIWAKRMNTLRYFVSMVTRWILRRRVQQRLAVVKAKINDVCHDVLSGPVAAFLTEKPKAMMGGATTAAAAEASLNKKKRALHRAMKECVRAWINDENSSNKVKGGSLAASSLAEGGEGPPATVAARSGGEGGGEDQQPFSFEQCATVAELVCASDDAFIVRRHKSEVVLTGARIEMTSRDTVQRLLFPKCIVEEGNTLQQLAAPAIEVAPPRFDDRSFFPLKVRPEYVSLRYAAHRVPDVPLFFPTGRDKPLRTGAPEEAALRPPADFTASGADLLSTLPPEPPALAEIRATALIPPPTEEESGPYTTGPLAVPRAVQDLLEGVPQKAGGDDSTATLAILAAGGGIAGQTLPPTPEHLLPVPAWLAPSDGELLVGDGGDAGARWTAQDIDFFRPRSDLRMYPSAPVRKETDADWLLRPYASSTSSSSRVDPDALKYKDDGSVRSRWLSAPGFSSAHIYLLGSLESCCTRSSGPGPPRPAPGPTLTDCYRPDTDRHHSGLFCFRRDHLRSLTAVDLDYGPLQHRQDRADLLTDSESDDDDKYMAPKPTMKRVRALLISSRKNSAVGTPIPTKSRPISAAKGAGKPPSPGKDAVAAGALSSALAGDADDNDPSATVAEQVELMRDRKTLELESALLKVRNDRAAAFAERLSELSKASKCLLQAVAVQLSLHMYEERAAEPFATKITPVLKTFVQAGKGPSTSSSSSSS